MGQGNFTEDFKLDAIRQITQRGHSVSDVSKRLGVSPIESLCHHRGGSRICDVADSFAGRLA